jgi:hypothetical protein
MKDQYHFCTPTPGELTVTRRSQPTTPDCARGRNIVHCIHCQEALRRSLQPWIVSRPSRTGVRLVLLKNQRGRGKKKARCRRITHGPLPHLRRQSPSTSCPKARSFLAMHRLLASLERQAFYIHSLPRDIENQNGYEPF